MSVATLVKKRTDPRIIEQLDLAMERARCGKVHSIAIVCIGDDDIASTYIGDPIALVYGVESLKLDLLGRE
jgi:hypothetical protein